jgi:hypothetical protein
VKDLRLGRRQIPGRGLIEQVQFFARLEPDGPSRRNWHFRTGPWVPANSGLARPHAEDSKPAQLDAVASGQRILHAFEHCVHRRLRLHAGKSGPVRNFMDYILFNHWISPDFS